ncbi:MAG: restriction endonuclease subunit S [Phaeodactylibacter sp.]|uniref:restriction endonuclease subunit S n=1 Tax=Phaeodactylibacter sp. TaxID=1940289 RepID=UPI0032ED8170
MTNHYDNIPSSSTQHGHQKTKLGWLPGEWEVVKLEKLAHFISGGTPSKNNPDFWDGEIPWYSAKDLKSFWLQSSIDKVSKLGSENGTRIVEKSTILILVRGMMLNRDLPLGITTLKSTFNQDIKALVPKQNCDTVYIAHSILNRKSKILGLVNRSSHGTGKLETSTLKSLLFPLPPLPEQQKIATILSTWDRAIALTRQLLQEKEAQKKGLMQRLLTGKVRVKGFEEEWQNCHLDKLTSKVSNGMVYDTKNINGERITRIETISNGEINFGKTGFVSKEEENPKYLMREGDILYSHINSLTHIGKVAYYNGQKKLYHGMNLSLIRCNSLAIPKFVYYWLKSSLGKKWAWKFAKKAVSQASISTSEIKNIVIKVPIKKEQTAIAAILTQADEEIRLLREKERALQAQKKGLMQRLLTGKVRVKVD